MLTSGARSGRCRRWNIMVRTRSANPRFPSVSPRVAILKAPMRVLVFGPFLSHYFCDATSFSVLYSHHIARPTNATEA
jgi:hypothetical protein